MEPILAYFAGLLTLINPCVLPVLPIVLAGALQAGRAGPLYLAAGMAVSFIGLGFTVASFGFALGIDEDTVARAGAVLMVIFGAVLLVPQASARFSTATSGFAARIDVEASRVDGAHLRGWRWRQVVAGGHGLGSGDTRRMSNPCELRQRQDANDKTPRPHGTGRCTYRA